MNNHNDNNSEFNRETKPSTSPNMNRNNTTRIFSPDSYPSKYNLPKHESYPKRPKNLQKTTPNSLNQIMDDLSSLKDMAKLHQETIDQLKQDNYKMLQLIGTYMSQLSDLYPDADSFNQKDDLKTETDNNKSEYSRNSDKNSSSFEDDDIICVSDEEEDEFN